MAHSDTEDLYDATTEPKQLVLPLEELLVYDTVAYERTIHSGHFMVSHVHEEIVVEQENILHENIIGNITENLMDADIFETKIETTKLEPIDQSLEKLFKCMNLVGGGKLTSPKWKNFKGVKFRLKEKIRLNNIIWREWHMQFVYHLRPIICQFSSLITFFDSINKDCINDKKYWHQHLQTIANDYKKWRNFFNERFSNLDLDKVTKKVPYCEILQRTSENNSKQLRRLGGFLSKPLFHTVSIAPPKVPQKILLNCLLEDEEMLYDEFSDSIYSATGISADTGYSLNDLDDDLSKFPLFDEASFFPSKIKCISNEPNNLHKNINDSIEEESKNEFYPNDNLPNYHFNNHEILINSTHMNQLCVNDSFVNKNNIVEEYQNLENHLDFNDIVSTNNDIMSTVHDPVVQFPNNSSHPYLQSNQYLFHIPQNNTLSIISTNKNLRKNNSDQEQNISSAQIKKIKLKKKHSLESFEVDSQPSDSEVKFKIPKSKNYHYSKSKSSFLPNILPKTTSSHVSQKVVSIYSPINTEKSTTSLFNLHYFQPVKDIKDNTNRLLNDSLLKLNPLNAVFQPINPINSDQQKSCREWHADEQVQLSFKECLMKVMSTSMKNLDTKFRLIDDVCASSSNSNSDGLLLDNLSSSNSSMHCRSRHTSNESNSSFCDDSSRGSLSEQKRSIHIISEQKRRHSIQYGIETLNELIGVASGVRISKASTLQTASEFCYKLKMEKLHIQEEIDKIKNDIEENRNYINQFQRLLPENGVKLSRRTIYTNMQVHYSTYLQSRLFTNWKYYILKPICDDLFNSFKTCVASASNKTQLMESLNRWLKQHCSLFHLREMLSNSLLNLCLKTSMLQDPARASNEIQNQLFLVR